MVIGLIKKGMNYLCKNGIIITTIAVFKRLKKRYEPEYYQKAVLKTAASVGSDLQVHGPTSVNENTTLGDNNNFNGMKIRGKGSVTIGNNFHSGSDCEIITQNHNYDNGEAIPYDDTYIYRKVCIEDNVWLGSRVIILPGVTIEEGAIIQAGSTVTDDIPKGTIAGGHPAEVFEKRDMQHYEKLKSKGKFH